MVRDGTMVSWEDVGSERERGRVNSEGREGGIVHLYNSENSRKRPNSAAHVPDSWGLTVKTLKVTDTEQKVVTRRHRFAYALPKA